MSIGLKLVKYLIWQN